MQILQGDRPFLKKLSKLKKKRLMEDKSGKKPHVPHTLNAQRTVKQTTQQKIFESVHVPRRKNQKQNHPPDQKTRRLAMSMMNSLVSQQLSET